ncbi:MAG: cell division ATP-binding protein FtsE [Deltaproteobacteria bacterium]|nr:cell division ATP-binding protein FtsE [Deltaproteobacteria bacterium]
MIRMFHVSKNYEGGSFALSDVTLKIAKGEFVFITGSSGAGKTTLLKIMFGSEAPSEGQIIIDGRNYFKIPRAEIPYLRRRIGFVFQDFKLLPQGTVFENVALSLKVMGVGSIEVKRRVQKVLSYVKLSHRANFRAAVLSGGEAQRVAIARALVKDPAIILADEPTGNLDPHLAVETIELFKEVNGRGTTVVVATHDSTLIARYAKRAIGLESGRVVA